MLAARRLPRQGARLLRKAPRQRAARRRSQAAHHVAEEPRARPAVQRTRLPLNAYDARAPIYGVWASSCLAIGTRHASPLRPPILPTCNNLHRPAGFGSLRLVVVSGDGGDDHDEEDDGDDRRVDPGGGRERLARKHVRGAHGQGGARGHAGGAQARTGAREGPRRARAPRDPDHDRGVQAAPRAQGGPRASGPLQRRRDPRGRCALEREARQRPGRVGQPDGYAPLPLRSEYDAGRGIYNPARVV